MGGQDIVLCIERSVLSNNLAPQLINCNVAQGN
jgi:hypothetical protein